MEQESKKTPKLYSPDKVSVSLASNTFRTYKATEGTDNPFRVEWSTPYYHTGFQCNSARIATSFGDWKDSKLKDVCEYVLATYYNQSNPVIEDDVLVEAKRALGFSAHAFGLIVTAWKKQNYARVEDSLKRPLYLILGSDNPAENARAQGAEMEIGTRNCGYAYSNAAWAQNILDKLNDIYVTKEVSDFILFLEGNVFKLRSDDQTVRLAQIDEMGFGLDYRWTPDYPPYFTNYLDEGEERFEWLLNEQVTYVKNVLNKYPFLRYVFKHIKAVHPTEYDFTRDLKKRTMHIWKDFDGSLEALLYDATMAGIPMLETYEFARVFKPDFVGGRSLPGIVSAPFGETVLFTESQAEPIEDALVDKFSRTIVTRACLAVAYNTSLIYRYNGTGYEYKVLRDNPYFCYYSGHNPTAAQANAISEMNFRKCNNTAVANGVKMSVESQDQATISGTVFYWPGDRDYYINSESIEAIYNQSGFKQFYNFTDVTGSVNDTEYK